MYYRGRRLRVPEWLLNAVLVVGILFVLINYVNPLSDGAMIRRFNNNRDALVDMHSSEFVSEAAEERWRKNLRVGRNAWFRHGTRLFEIFTFDGFDGRAAKGYAYQPEFVEESDVHLVNRIRGTIGIIGDVPIEHQFRHIEGHWYLYWVRSPFP